MHLVQIWVKSDMSYNINTIERAYVENGVEKSMSWYNIVDEENVPSEIENSDYEEIAQYQKHLKSLNQNIFRKKVNNWNGRPSFCIELKKSYISKFLYWLECIDGVEIYKPRSRRFFYNFQINGVEFRVLPSLNVIEMGDNDFDRWANSGLNEVNIPTNKNEFLSVMEELNQIKIKERGTGFLRLKNSF